MEAFFEKLAAFDLPIVGASAAILLSLGAMVYFSYLLATAPLDDGQD